MLFVDTGLLHSGGSQSHHAGGLAQEGADQLCRGPLLSRMFGSFAAAEAFHEALSVAHAMQVRDLQAHQEALTAIGGRAHQAATGFADVDERNAAQLRAVRCSSNT